MAAAEMPKNTWDQVLGRLQSKLSVRAYRTWFKPTKFQAEDSGRVTVTVPNSLFAECLRTQYAEKISEALDEIDCKGLEVDFRSELPDRLPPHRSTEAPVGLGGEPGRTSGDQSGELASGRVPRLNPRYNFETFVVSSCNQFAHAASLAVADQPARAYNPLYIYGGVGLGKTHLMQAIGNRCLERKQRLRYVSSEVFVNELINAIRFEKTQEFKQRYRDIDVLLIDDIQFLAGKERTQEEFFHTFNALYDDQKQIVITSDLPPRDIPTLEERLRSRFEWGLLADIQPPDLETKIAILRKKVESQGVDIPDDVTLFIASNCGSNIRELEGALTKVMAFAKLSGATLSVETAREQLRHFLPVASPATTVESIQKLVASFFNLKISDLKSRNNSPQVSQPRQIAMYLCKKKTPCSLPDIGRRFGGKHHTTVIHAVQKIEKKRAAEPEFEKLVDNFLRSLK